MPNVSDEPRLFYCMIKSELTLFSAGCALRAVEEGLRDAGLSTDVPVELWTKPDHFMFAVSVGGWDKYDEMRADGWTDHGPLGVVPIYAVPT